MCSSYTKIQPIDQIGLRCCYCYCNTATKQQLCWEEWYHKKLLKLDFVAIFVAFAPGLLTRLYHQTATESP